MAFTTRLVNMLFSNRREEIEYFKNNAAEVQQKQLEWLLKKCSTTIFGQDYGFSNINSIEQFQQRVDLYDYETFSEFIARTKAGEKNVIWPTDIRWFAKSSGTTDAKSKYVPVTNEGLSDCHYQGPRDVIAMFANNYPDADVYSGKTLTLGGSRKIEREGENVLTGDLSAILIENTPMWAETRRVPCAKTALIPDFEQKIVKIYEEAIGENITSFAGVPSWNLVMMNKILELSGKNNLLEIWPNLELFVHGGMNFKPYRELYRKIIPTDNMKYMETYNASEGFFAIGDDPTKDDMLLMLDYHVFYEFLPMDHLGDRTKVIPLEDVKCGVNYAMIITTSNGLWRYTIGDTVQFTSTSPYRIRITGRTKHYVNAFGEEIVVDNAESAIRKACDATGAEIADFSAAPIYMEGRKKGAHEWVIEFVRTPDSIAKFAEVLDIALQAVNSDYEAKRLKNTTLMPPKVSVVRDGTFNRWMNRRGKIGGQNKVPRLFNDRSIIEQLLETDKLSS